MSEILSKSAAWHYEPIATATARLKVAAILGNTAFYGIIAAILASAIPNGSVAVSSRSFLAFAICIFAVFRLLASFLVSSFRLSNPGLLLPLISILCLASAQAVQFPGNITVSVDPYETKQFIIFFGSIVVAGEVMLRYTNTLGRLKVLIATVIIVGLASSIFGIYREIFLDSPAASFIGFLDSRQGYAQFLNRNHFALLAEMSLGLNLGLLIKGRLSRKQKLVGWIIAGIFIYSLLTVNSRGGLVSLAALSIFATFIHTMTGKFGSGDSRIRAFLNSRSFAFRITAAVGLSTAVFAIIVVATAFVGGDRVVTRVESLPDEIQVQAQSKVNRAAIWNSTTELIKENPVSGVGFGGYAAAIPKFDTSSGKFSLQQAHNDYLEILANGGLIAIAFFAWFGAAVARRAVRNLASPHPLRGAAAFGAAIGIFSVLIHSFVDFGVHIPTNALLFSILIVIATVNIPDDHSASAHRFRTLRYG